ncbi:hypothetical protein DL765_010676 [Monosporascus sp. GIB2]|nr:hypothetical protein DL765_010676 [Monosporascus sp. GIB2]
MAVNETRAQLAPGTNIMVAIGGWGDTAGFSLAAATEEGRQRWARNVATMLRDTGADDYKQVLNEQKAWEIGAYPLLMAEVRTAIGPDKLISVAVPGLPRDVLPFTAEALPTIMESVDFLNVMTYEMMNRRDTVTKHHAGKALREGQYDNIGGGYYYWDVDQDLWSHKTPSSIEDKFELVRELELGSVFAWERGADGPEYSRLAALNAAVGGPRPKKDEL